MAIDRNLRCGACVVISLVLLAAASLPAAAQWNYANPHWYITLDSYGYSDFLIYTSGPFPAMMLHEMLSGEFAAGIGYDGIESTLPSPNKTMWLPPFFDYPSWDSNSTFTVVSELTAPQDTDADGLPEGNAVISNGDVEIRIDFDMIDTVTGTPMGLRDGKRELSNRYVMLVTYTVRNLKLTSLTNLRFYQFLHGHPANTEAGTVRAVYDPTLHTGARQEYRYDVTQFVTSSGDIGGEPTGCTFEDLVNIGGDVMPGTWGLGHYRGHGERPPTGLHLDVENDTLGAQTTFGPDEVAGAARWNVASLAPGASQAFRVLLAVRSLETSPKPANTTACLTIGDDGGPEPRLTLRRGACAAPQPATRVADILQGDLRELSGGEGLPTTVYEGSCIDDYNGDRLTVDDELAPCQPSTFVVARWGGATPGSWGNDSTGVPRGFYLCP